MNIKLKIIKFCFGIVLKTFILNFTGWGFERTNLLVYSTYNQYKNSTYNYVKNSFKYLKSYVKKFRLW